MIYLLNYKKNYSLRYNRLKNHFLGVKSPLSKQLCKVSLCIDTFVSGCWLMSATLSQFCRNFGNENSLCVRFKLATITEPSHELFPNPFHHCQNRYFSCFEDPWIERFSDIWGEVPIALSDKIQFCPMFWVSMLQKPINWMSINLRHVRKRFIKTLLQLLHVQLAKAMT